MLAGISSLLILAVLLLPQLLAASKTNLTFPISKIIHLKKDTALELSVKAGELQCIADGRFEPSLLQTFLCIVPPLPELLNMDCHAVWSERKIAYGFQHHHGHHHRDYTHPTDALVAVEVLTLERTLTSLFPLADEADDGEEAGRGGLESWGSGEVVSTLVARVGEGETLFDSLDASEHFEPQALLTPFSPAHTLTRPAEPTQVCFRAFSIPLTPHRGGGEPGEDGSLTDVHVRFSRPKIRTGALYQEYPFVISQTVLLSLLLSLPRLLAPVLALGLAIATYTHVLDVLPQLLLSAVVAFPVLLLLSCCYPVSPLMPHHTLSSAIRTLTFLAPAIPLGSLLVYLAADRLDLVPDARNSVLRLFLALAVSAAFFHIVSPTFSASDDMVDEVAIQEELREEVRREGGSERRPSPYASSHHHHLRPFSPLWLISRGSWLLVAVLFSRQMRSFVNPRARDEVMVSSLLLSLLVRFLYYRWIDPYLSRDYNPPPSPQRKEQKQD